VRAKVRILVKDGKTGSHIARALGISLPSVQNIKKALGLVKPSKKASTRPKARRSSARAAPKAKRKRATPKKALSAQKPNPATPEAPGPVS